jgi:hypothetical protein
MQDFPMSRPLGCDVLLGEYGMKVRVNDGVMGLKGALCVIIA